MYLYTIQNFSPSFLFEMILRQTLFIRLLHVQNEEVQDHVEGSDFKQRFLETTLENPNDNVRKYVMKTFKCIKRCQIVHLKSLDFQKILWGREGVGVIDNMST